MQSSIIIAVIAAITIGLLVNSNNTLRHDVAIKESENIQLTTSLEITNKSHEEANRLLDQERRDNESLMLQSSVLKQHIRDKANESKQKLLKLSINDEVVKDWAVSPVPDSIVGMLNRAKVSDGDEGSN